MAKKIKFSLNEASIDNAIKELEAYKRSVEEKTERLRIRVAEIIANDAQAGFNSSGVDDDLREGMRPAAVSVSYRDNGDVTIVLAEGTDAVWVEFGAGVHYNGPVGQSPNPLGRGLGLTIGSYGKGHGARHVWGYKENGELVLTHGTPATMPMYKAVQAVCNNIDEIAKEVFRT